MSLMMKLIFGATGPRTLRQFAEQCSSPATTQENLLHHLLSANADTAYGRNYDFASLRNFQDYQRAVPVVTYSDIEPYVQKAMEGEPRQLTAEAPVLFATTGGASDFPKYIPVTPEGRSARSQLMRVWLSALSHDHPDIFSGRILTLVSPEVESYAHGDVPCGSESGHAYRNMPKAMLALYSAPYEVFEIRRPLARFYTLLRIAAAQPISFIAVASPSAILFLGEQLIAQSPNIIRDIHDGGVNEDIDMSKQLRDELKSQLPPNPRRARELEEIAATSGGVLPPRKVWPHLAAIGCWKGGTAGLDLGKFAQYFEEDVPTRDLGYLTSEHRGSVPISDSGDAGVLAISTGIYEFFPVGADRQPEPHELLSVEQLEKGKQYHIYTSTLSGLYRYDLEDIIEVVGFYEKTPLIRFVQKASSVVSLAGEKLWELQMLTAVQDVLKSRQGRYHFIAAVGETEGDPETGAQPRYVLMAEFEDFIDRTAGRGIALQIEAALCRQNMGYATSRATSRLAPLALRVIKHGEFERYRARQAEQSKLDAQFKIMRLTTDTYFAGQFRSEYEYAADIKTTPR